MILVSSKRDVPLLDYNPLILDCLLTSGKICNKGKVLLVFN